MGADMSEREMNHQGSIDEDASISMKLFDANVSTNETITLQNICTIKHGADQILIVFNDPRSQKAANQVLAVGDQSITLPEFSSGKPFAVAHINHNYDQGHGQPVIKTDYKKDDFSGHFNYDIYVGPQKSMLLTLLSTKTDAVEILDSITEITFRQGVCVVAFDNDKSFEYARKKTNWQDAGLNCLRFHINSLKQIDGKDGRSKEFDEMLICM